MEVIPVDVLQVGSDPLPPAAQMHEDRRLQKVVIVVADEEEVIAVLGPSPQDVNCGVVMAVLIGDNNAEYPARRRSH